MGIATYLVTGRDAETALAVLRAKVGGAAAAAGLVVYFADAGWRAEEVARGMARLFPKARTLGCSSYASCCSGVIARNSLAAMLIATDQLAGLTAKMVDKLSPATDLHPMFGAIRVDMTGKTGRFSPEDHVGLLLVDAARGWDDVFMEKVGDCSDTLFVGGSASNSLERTEESWVALDGAVAKNAGVIAVLEPAVPFLAAKVQSYRVADGQPPLVVTKVNPANRREAWEINGMPADQAYLEAYNLDGAAICGDLMASNPLGVLANGELFVRCFRTLRPGTGVEFLGGTFEGQELRVLEPTDVVADMAARLAEFKARLGGEVAGLLEFLCYNRYMTTVRSGRMDDYQALFRDIPCAGFATFGETYLGYVNCTSTLLAFGKR